MSFFTSVFHFVFPYFFFRQYTLRTSSGSWTDIKKDLFNKKDKYTYKIILMLRLDRPVGAFLLLFPCYFGLGIGKFDIYQGYNSLHIIYFYFLFFIGAFLMRGAGCIINDIFDKDIDKKVERTKVRPLASGSISIYEALAILFFILLFSLLVLFFFNKLTIFVSVLSLLFVVIYPLIKRFSNLPQLVLGIAFNWGVLVGYTAITDSFSSFILVLYFGSIFWTIGYDTIYAYMDIEDDIKVGVGSTAVLIAEKAQLFIFSFYMIFFISIIYTLYYLNASYFSYLLSILVFLHLIWQVLYVDITSKNLCLFMFKSNIGVGFLVSLIFLVA